jgi:hypothetical protein
MSTIAISETGAVGDAATNDGPAIQRAIDACAAGGGGTVVVPAGRTWMSGSLCLKSRVELHIERGAVLQASSRPTDYIDAGRCGQQVFLSGADAVDAAITGGGVIDGRGTSFMTHEYPHMYKCIGAWRPSLISLYRCHQLTVRDITLKDAANWTLHMTGCEDVLVHGIRIRNGLKVPNCDGIDPDHCRRVRISDCHIEAGDDCIVIKNRPGFPELGPCEDITVTNCICVSTSFAIKIGTESHAAFRNIAVSNCIVRGSNRGLGIQLRDGGDVEDVSFNNCIVETRLFHDDWWGKAEPIHVSAIPRRRDAPLGSIRRVRFANILARGEAGAYLAALAPGHIEDVAITGSRIEVRHAGRIEGGWHDRRPCCVPGLVRHPTAGIYAQHVAGLTVRDTDVVWGGKPQPWHGHGIEALACPGLRLDRNAVAASGSGLEAVRIADQAPVEALGEREDRGREAAGL